MTKIINVNCADIKEDLNCLIHAQIVAIESDLQLDAILDNEEWLERHTSYEELVREAKRRGILDYIGTIIFSTLWKDIV